MIFLHRQNGARLLAALMLAAAPLAARPAALGMEDYELDPNAIQDLISGRAALSEYWPAEEDWQKIWDEVQAALQSTSYDRLAELTPYVHQALTILEMNPASRPVGDWLIQRIDYFDVAEEATHRLPGVSDSGKAEASPRPPPVKKWTAMPPPRPPPAVPAAVARRQREFVESEAVWQQRLRERPAPAQAGALAPELKRVFSEEGLPPELIWMAEVESSFNPVARSPSGAVGLFQLMPATARQYGLRLWPRDERKDPEKNARSAARHLRSLYEKYQSWPLTLAAYNAGSTRVDGLLSSQPGAGFPAIAWGLPAETQMYVPKTLALIRLRENVTADQLSAPRRSGRADTLVPADGSRTGEGALAFLRADSTLTAGP